MADLTEAERLERADITWHCQEWDGPTSRKGYGRIKVDGRMTLVHRLVCEEANGTIPDGMCVCHHCDNPPCINIAHLFLGTRADNNADKIAKGRMRVGRMPGEQNPAAKFANDVVQAIRARAATGESQASIGRALGVSRSHVGQLVRDERR